MAKKINVVLSGDGDKFPYSERKISLIIPCFNEGNRLPIKFDKSYKFLSKKLIKFELILINDGSKDNTAGILENLKKNYPKVKVISYLENKGKGYAIKQGIDKATGEIIGFTDADFAIDLRHIKEVISRIDSGFDLVIGNRKSSLSRLTNNPSIFRKFFSFLHSNINNLFLKLGPIKDTLCGFKFFKRKVAKELFNGLKIYRWFFDLEILIKAKEKNYSIFQIPVTWEQFPGSKVKVTSAVISSIKENLIIYSVFFNSRIYSFLLILILFFIFLPFLFNPTNLTLRNGDFSDLVWPNYYFIKQSILKYHQIPLWNRTLFSGIPEIANPQSPIIYPPNILALILPLDYAILILIFLHAFICGIFLYLAGKILNWRNGAAVVFSLGYTLSPFIWSKVSVGHLSMVFAMFLLGPIIYFALSCTKRFTLFNFSLFSLSLLFQYLNYPTIWYYTYLFGIFFSFLYFIINKRFDKMLIIILGVFSSIVLLLPIFLIHLQAGPLITRSNLSINDLAIPIWSIKRFLASVLIPSNFLNDLETESWLYPGISIMLLGFLGWIKLSNKFKIIYLLITSIVILITLGTRTPLQPFLVKTVPFFSYLRVVTRDWFVLVFFAVLLAAFGLNKMKRYYKILLLLVFLDLFIFSILRLWHVPNIMRPFSNVDLNKLLVANDGRYYCTNRCLSARDTIVRSINTADGYHLIILKNYRDALSKAGGFDPPKYTGNIPSIDNYLAQPDAEKLAQFSVKYVISPYLIYDKNFEEIKSVNGYLLYKNKLFLPRLRFENQNLNSIRVVEDTPNYIKINTKGKGDMLILADTFYPGWEVKIDNIKTRLIEKFGWAKAVKVPDGEHTIQFEFKPFRNLLND